MAELRSRRFPRWVVWALVLPSFYRRSWRRSMIPEWVLLTAELDTAARPPVEPEPGLAPAAPVGAAAAAAELDLQ